MFEPVLNERPRRVEWPLLLALLGLMLVGVAFIYSATMGNQTRTYSQMVWYGVGFLMAVAVCFVDYHLFARWANLGYWIMIVLLVAVLVKGIGVVRLGARRWIELGLFQFQPSEFAKLAFIFMMANFLSRPIEELRQSRLFVKALGMTLLPFILILKEPDLGSALVLLPVALAMMFVAGVPTKYLVRVLGCVGLLVALLMVDILFAPANWQIKLEDYQRRRLLVYFGVDYASADASQIAQQNARVQQRNDSWNVEQALISVGSGGLWGKGWRQGTQNALGYLPRAVAPTDFIFSVVAEEKGFVGSIVVIGLYTVVLISGMRIAGQARDRLGKLLAVGVVILLFSHIFINIGMNIRLMPVTGIPLPLLSYGGSSVLCSMIAAGILQNVYLYRRAY
jgi:rod shape determining protein RodA